MLLPSRLRRIPPGQPYQADCSDGLLLARPGRDDRMPHSPEQQRATVSPGHGDVTVVVATRNRRAQVLSAVGHLTALPEQPPVIVVDNGSTDGTAQALLDAYPQVTVLRPGRNLGATGRTLGGRAARTPYVAFADDDSWWKPGALGQAAAVFDATPGLALIAARILVGPGERLDPVCELMAASALGTEPGMPGPSVLGFVSCGSVLRRTAYLQVGGFSPVIFFLGEETVLAQDLAAAGWSLCYVDTVTAVHHPLPGPERMGRSTLNERNALLSTWLRRPAGVVVSRTWSALRPGADPVARRALGQAARRLPLVLADRRRLPEQVEAAVRLLEG